MRRKVGETASAPAPVGVEDNFHPSSSEFGENREIVLPAVDGSDLRRMWGDARFSTRMVSKAKTMAT
jgi:hypothetical protein